MGHLYVNTSNRGLSHCNAAFSHINADLFTGKMERELLSRD